MTRLTRFIAVKLTTNLGLVGEEVSFATGKMLGEALRGFLFIFYCKNHMKLFTYLIFCCEDN